MMDASKEDHLQNMAEPVFIVMWPGTAEATIILVSSRVLLHRNRCVVGVPCMHTAKIVLSL